MTVVNYTGDSHVRKLSQATLAAAGFNIPGGITWSKQNAHRVNVADPALVAYLLAIGGFSADGVETFVDALSGAGGGAGGVAPLMEPAADLAATNPVPSAGQQVVAIDTGQFGVGDGVTPWNSMLKIESSGRELAYSSMDAVHPVTNVNTDIPDLDILEFEVGSRPVYVELLVPWVAAVGTTAWFGCTIADLANASKATGAANLRGVAATPGGAFAVERIDVPGSYSRKARMQSGANPGANINGGLSNIFVSFKAIER